MLSARDCTEAETTAVIVSHLPFVVSIIFVSQANPLDRVVLAIKLHEDSYQFLGYESVADHLTLMRLSVVVPMHQSQITQVATMDDIIGLISLALHLLPDAVRNLVDRETGRKILALRRKYATEPE